MDHPLPIDPVRPWRTFTLVASAVATLELVALVGVGLVILGKPLAHRAEAAAVRQAAAPIVAKNPTVRPPAPGAPHLARSQTSVLVLNGNGHAGAAGEAAARVRGLGYIVGGVGNAPRSDYGATVVMYRSGYRGEASRLARDVGVKSVGPLDGLRPGDLQGAHLALVLGN